MGRQRGDLWTHSWGQSSARYSGKRGWPERTLIVGTASCIANSLNPQQCHTARPGDGHQWPRAVLQPSSGGLVSCRPITETLKTYAEQ